MIKKYRWQLMISSAIILLPIVMGLFGIPLIFLAVHWICIFFTARDPKNKDQSSKIFGMIFWILPIISLVVCGFVSVVALGIKVNSSMLMRVPLGIMFVVFGNYMPKCKQNHTIGVKVTWALRNEENWNKTHRFTGRLWVFGGFLLLATLLVPTENIMYVFFLLILIMAVAPVIYSYVYYRKQLKAGTAAKEDATPFPATKISLVVGIVIFALAMLSLFIGKFEVEFDETSFHIEASSWEKATVNYADINHIEYREQSVRGTRTFGYGTPFIVMGECENSEYGSYTGYVYKSCDACVIITVDDKILVFNGKDEERTKAIYDELVVRTSKSGKQ